MGAGAGDSRGASPSKSPAALRPGTSTTSTLIDTPSSVAVLSNQTGTSSSGRPFFGDRPTAPFRDAFRRKPRLTEQSKKGKPSPSSFIHPSTTPLSSVQSAVRLPPSYIHASYMHASASAIHYRHLALTFSLPPPPFQPVVTHEIDAAYYEANHADISMVRLVRAHASTQSIHTVQ